MVHPDAKLGDTLKQIQVLINQGIEMLSHEPPAADQAGQYLERARIISEQLTKFLMYGTLKDPDQGGQ
jgi:hypothetical protein